MWRGGGRRRNAGRDTYFTLLLLQLGQQVAQLERKPPVTIAVMLACFACFFEDALPDELRALVQVPRVSAACLQPQAIWRHRQWGRLVWSALLHADEAHLYFNMSSLLWKGAQLEPRLGSLAFAGLLAELLLLSHGLVVVTAAAAAHWVPEYAYMWRSSCAIGASAVLFGLKVVLNHDAPGFSSVLGFSLPTKYMCWAELLLASAINPRASFAGHLCGIAAGWLHVSYIAPALSSWRQGWRSLRRASAAAARRSAGRVPGQPGAAPRAASGPAPAAAAAAAAAAARVQAEQQRGVPAARRQAAGERLGGGVGPAPGPTLTTDELRVRRLRALGGGS